MSEDCIRAGGEHIDHDTVTGGKCWPASAAALNASAANGPTLSEAAYDQAATAEADERNRDAGRTNPPSDAGPDPAWLASRVAEVEREVRENPGPIVRDREIVGELVHTDVCHANRAGACNCMVGAPRKPRRRAR